jgi:hypothetical protein
MGVKVGAAGWWHPAKSDALRAALRGHGLPLLLYAALAALMTWPLALNMGVAVQGVGYDSWQNMWNMWWLKRALLGLHNPYVTDALYYPYGASLYLHTLNPINFILSLPVHALFGLVVAYNFVIIGSLCASGYTAYLLAHDVTRDRPAALVGGAVFACSGYLLAQVMGGHTHMVAAEWLPLAALALRRLTASPGVRRALLAGALLAVNVLCDWQYFLFIMLWAVCYALAVAWARRSLRAALPIAAAAAVAVALVLPLLVPTARLALQTPSATTEGGAAFRTDHSVDLAGFLIPSQLHPLWGPAATRAQWFKSHMEIQNKTAYLGVPALALGLLALRRRSGRWWMLGAALFALLAMGPQLQLAGLITRVPLPAAIIYALPFANISRYPVRFVVIAMLALAVAAAIGVRQLLARLDATRPGRASALLAAALVALVALDNLARLPLVGIYIPPVYAEMARDGERYGIFEAPLSYRSSAAFLLYQTVHGKGIVGGYISRTQPYPLMGIPLVRVIANAQDEPDIVAQNGERIASSVFSYFNIRYLMLHSTGGALRYGDLTRFAAAAAEGAPPEPVDWMLRYAVARPAQPLPFIGLGEGWGDPVPTGEGDATRELAAPAALTVYSARPARAALTITLASPAPGSLRASVGARALPPLALVAGSQTLRIPLDLPAGETPLLLEPQNGALTVRAVDLEAAQP